MASVHELLDKKDIDLNELESFIKNDRLTVNEMDTSKFTPLQRVIKDKKFPVEVVQLLLSHGAYTDAVYTNTDKPLMLSLQYKREIEIVRLLLNAGAKIRYCRDTAGHSPLCFALRDDPSPDLIRILLEAGAFMFDCQVVVTRSSLSCAMRFHPDRFEIKAEVVKLLVKQGTTNNIISQYFEDGRSLLCHALSWYTEPDSIRSLLEAGCPLDACKKHKSAIMACATSGPGLLKAATLQVLLDAGVKISKHYVVKCKYGNCCVKLSAVSIALRDRTCEVEAIKILYDLQIECLDGVEVDPNQLLQTAVTNPHCPPSIVQYLIDLGADPDAYNSCKCTTALKLAIENCQEAVIQVLLDNDCSVNQKVMLCRDNCTALKIALDLEKDVSIIELLLKYGSRLGAADSISNILEDALFKYDSNQSEGNLSMLKVLLKYAYLEDPKFKIQNLDLGSKYYGMFSDLENECSREISLLKSYNIFQYFRRFSDHKPKHNGKGDKLFKVLSTNTFTVYFDMIRSTFGKKAVETRLQVQLFYFFTTNSEGLSRKVLLNQYIVSKIASFLSFEDKFNWLVGSYNDPTIPNRSVKAGLKRKRK